LESARVRAILPKVQISTATQFVTAISRISQLLFVFASRRGPVII
jgi:hypothetical protein